MGSHDSLVRTARSATATKHATVANGMLGQPHLRVSSNVPCIRNSLPGRRSILATRCLSCSGKASGGNSILPMYDETGRHLWEYSRARAAHGGRRARAPPPVPSTSFVGYPNGVLPPPDPPPCLNISHALQHQTRPNLQASTVPPLRSCPPRSGPASR